MAPLERESRSEGFCGPGNGIWRGSEPPPRPITPVEPGTYGLKVGATEKSRNLEATEKQDIVNIFKELAEDDDLD